MKITLGNLILLINEKENEVGELHYEVLRNSTMTIDKEVSGAETLLSKVKDFDKLMIQYDSALDELTNYRKTLLLTNSNTLLNNAGITVVEAINRIRHLRKELNLLESLCDKKESLERRFDGNGGSSYYRAVEFNFDMDEAKDFKERIKETISNLESEIQTINATTYVVI